MGDLRKRAIARLKNEALFQCHACFVGLSDIDNYKYGDIFSFIHSNFCIPKKDIAETKTSCLKNSNQCSWHYEMVYFAGTS